MVRENVLTLAGEGELNSTQGGVEKNTTQTDKEMFLCGFTRSTPLSDVSKNDTNKSEIQEQEEEDTVFLNDAGSPESSMKDSGSEIIDAEEISAILKEMDALKGGALNADEIEEVQASFGEEDVDLSLYYFSDEDEEESSDEMYTAWDDMEYVVEASLAQKLSDSESSKIDEEAEIARMLEKREQMMEKRQRDQRRVAAQLYEHDQFDLPSVKALWLEDLDMDHQLPSFTMVLTSNEDPLFMRRLCVSN